MTPSRYFIARIAMAFGYLRRTQRISDAASEMHLLRDAEAQLGAAIWRNVENIETISVEYWNLRKLVKEREQITLLLDECQKKLKMAHDERAAILNSPPEVNDELVEKRMALLAELEEHAHQRDRVVAEARDIRRAYVALKTKLEVLVGETGNDALDQDEISNIRQKLQELREKFALLKQERIRIGVLIEKGDQKVDEVDEELKKLKVRRREQAAEAFQAIGDGNKEISTLRAEMALIDTQMRQLYAEIGRYVSRNSHDPACAAAVAEHRSMVEVMRALRRSVGFNNRLAGNT